MAVSEWSESGWQLAFVLGGTVGDRHADIAEIVCRLGNIGGFSHLLDSSDQQAHQNGDDGDHHQEFNEGKSPSAFQNPMGYQSV